MEANFPRNVTESSSWRYRNFRGRQVVRHVNKRRGSCAKKKGPDRRGTAGKSINAQGAPEGEKHEQGKKGVNRQIAEITENNYSLVSLDDRLDIYPGPEAGADPDLSTAPCTHRMKLKFC